MRAESFDRVFPRWFASSARMLVQRAQRAQRVRTRRPAPHKRWRDLCCLGLRPTSRARDAQCARPTASLDGLVEPGLYAIVALALVEDASCLSARTPTQVLEVVCPSAGPELRGSRDPPRPPAGLAAYAVTRLDLAYGAILAIVQGEPVPDHRDCPRPSSAGSASSRRPSLRRSAPRAHRRSWTTTTTGRTSGVTF